MYVINMFVKSIMKWINYSYIFLLMIRSSCSGEHQVLCPSQTVLGLAGEGVILPCQVHPPVDMHDKKIEWSRAQLEPRYVHLINLEEDHDSSVNELFHYRTSVFEDELSKGNISLAIPHVGVSDEGTFTCSAPQFRSTGESCSIKLSVVEMSMPSITVIGLADGGLTLSCDSGCWYPEPEVTWLDAAGNVHPVQHSLTIAPDPSCHHIQTLVTVTRSANLTCRVRLPHMNYSYSYETHSIYNPGSGGKSTVHISEGVVSGCGVARAAIICFGVVMSSALLAAFCFCRRGSKWRKQWPWLCQVELPGESLLGVSSTAELDTDVMLVASSSNVEVSDSQRTADQVEVQSVSPPPNREQTLTLQRMASSMESMQSTWTHLSAVISTAANELTKREGGVSREEEKHK